MAHVSAHEKLVLDKLLDCYNEFRQLPPGHPEDNVEFVRAIHSAQNIILVRSALRCIAGDEHA